MAQQVCPFCQGKKVVQLSAASLPELCPVCRGMGVLEDPGLFFVYEITLQLAANVKQFPFQQNILNRPFRWLFAMATSTGPFSALIQDGSTQRNFSNQEVHVNNLFGNSQNPFPLLTPYQFNQKGQISGTMSDLSGAPNNVRMAFAGVELN